MNIKGALKGQYHASLAMLRQSIELCPDDLWLAGVHPRSYWRIAYHALFYAHLYLVQDEAAFQQWEKHREGCDWLWEDDNEKAPVFEPYSKPEILEYLDKVDGMVDEVIDALDLERADTGFPWYKNMTKLDHEIMSLRHIQGHVGQLSELLMARGIDTDWMGKRPREVVEA